MDPLIVKLLTALLIVVVGGCSIWFIQRISAPEPLSSFKWLGELIIAIICVFLLFKLVM